MRRMYRRFRTVVLYWLAIILAQAVLLVSNGSITSDTEDQAKLMNLSKAQLVGETRAIINRINLLEATAGQSQSAGYTIYPATITGQLWQLYRKAEMRIDILNTGHVTQITSIDGYLLSAAPVNNPYTTEQVREAIQDIETKIPGQFLKDYRIFLAPLSLPGVSGQGAAGFSIIYALPESFNATENDLRVTLYHELGHHIHMSYMPTQTAGGKELWEEYLDFRGGSWQEPGQANTAEWSKSSEETFAEDFRMIFGSNQPYFGDMALGDPRVQSGIVEAFRHLISKMAERPASGVYQSPWIPQGHWFWLHQEECIALMWLVVLLLSTGVHSRRKRDRRFAFANARVMTH